MKTDDAEVMVDMLLAHGHASGEGEAGDEGWSADASGETVRYRGIIPAALLRAFKHRRLEYQNVDFVFGDDDYQVDMSYVVPVMYTPKGVRLSGVRVELWTGDGEAVADIVYWGEDKTLVSVTAYDGSSSGLSSPSESTVRFRNSAAIGGIIEALGLRSSPPDAVIDAVDEAYRYAKNVENDANRFREELRVAVAQTLNCDIERAVAVIERAASIEAQYGDRPSWDEFVRGYERFLHEVLLDVIKATPAEDVEAAAEEHEVDIEELLEDRWADDFSSTVATLLESDSLRAATCNVIRANLRTYRQLLQGALDDAGQWVSMDWVDHVNISVSEDEDDLQRTFVGSELVSQYEVDGGPAKIAAEWGQGWEVDDEYRRAYQDSYLFVERVNHGAARNPRTVAARGRPMATTSAHQSLKRKLML
jgi:hypothetical protein